MSQEPSSTAQGGGSADAASSAGGASRPAALRAIFDAVADLPAAEVEAAIRARCGEDEQLAAEALGLVLSDRRAAVVLDEPSAAIGLGDAARSVAPMAQIPGFATLSLLGEGGFARVYVAEQLATRRTVALKVMASSIAGESARQRFDREVQVLARFDHPGIARLFEAGVYAGPDGVETPYFAMELVNGSPLTRYARWAGLEVRAILQLMAEVADAVGHAHTRAIVHRDLKPANILVDTHGRPKVLDFGLALARPEQGPASGPPHEAGAPDTTGSTGMALSARLVGTIAYMAPEQLAGDMTAICRATDVHALGVMLYEMLSGSHPLQLAGLLPHEAALKATGQPLPPLGSVNPRFRGDIEAIVSKATARRPEDRYASAADLRDDLIRHLNLQPTLARPLPAYARATRFINRHRLLSSAAGLVLACGAAALAALHQAEVQARAGRELAERTARETINTVLEGLSGVAGAIEPRARLLEQLLRNTEHFEQVLPNDRDAMLTRARVLEGMGDLLQESGMFASASRHRERAFQIISRLAERRPDDLDLQAHLSIAMVKRGDILGEMGDREGSIPWYRKALAVDERLHAADPQRRWFADNLCYSYERLGVLHLQRMELTEAEDLLSRRLTLAERLLDRNPAEEKSIRNLGFAHAYMASVHAARARWPQARADGIKAIELFTGLWQRRPANRDHTRDLIMVNSIYAEVLRAEAADSADAWAPLRRAAELADALYLAEDHSPQIAGILLSTYANLAEYLLRMNELDEASAAAHRVLTVGESLRQRSSGDPSVTPGSPDPFMARARTVLEHAAARSASGQAESGLGVRDPQVGSDDGVDLWPWDVISPWGRFMRQAPRPAPSAESSLNAPPGRSAEQAGPFPDADDTNHPGDRTESAAAHGAAGHRRGGPRRNHRP
jgi:serine/threonine protein kinase